MQIYEIAPNNYLAYYKANQLLNVTQAPDAQKPNQGITNKQIVETRIVYKLSKLKMDL